MKNLLILQLLICVFFLSCDTAVDKEEKKTADTEMLAEPAIALSDCKDVCPAKNPGDYEISKECYDCMTGNFAANGYKFTKYQDQDARGFKVAQAEFSEILKDIGATEGAEIYAMMGMKVTAEAGEGQAEPDLVFAVSIDGEYTYYDFTSPCPNYCPE